MHRFGSALLAMILIASPALALSTDDELSADFAGMISFAQGNCPLTVDMTAFAKVMNDRGVKQDVADSAAFQMRGIRAYQAMQKNPIYACSAALEKFGPEGTVIPGIVK